MSPPETEQSALQNFRSRVEGRSAPVFPGAWERFFVVTYEECGGSTPASTNSPEACDHFFSRLSRNDAEGLPLMTRTGANFRGKTLALTSSKAVHRSVSGFESAFFIRVDARDWRAVD
jgi:hypothetical protein